jgi:hypothetical protein
MFLPAPSSTRTPEINADTYVLAFGDPVLLLAEDIRGVTASCHVGGVGRRCAYPIDSSSPKILRAIAYLAG